MTIQEYSKSLSVRRCGTKDFANNLGSYLRRRRSVYVDVRLRLGLGGGRRIHDGRVALLFLARRIGDSCFLLLASRQERGAH